MVDLVHPSPSSPVPWCIECTEHSLGGDEHHAAPFPSRGGALAGGELALVGAVAVLRTSYQGLWCHRVMGALIGKPGWWLGVSIGQRMHGGGDKVSIVAGRGLG
jgi:hypothetical protein